MLHLPRIMAGFDREMKTESDLNEVGEDREVTVEIRVRLIRA